MYTIGVITTNHPKRFDLLTKTIDSIEKNDVRDITKILSVDEFSNFKTDFDFFSKIQEKGWEITFKNHSGKNSMVTNQFNLLEKVKTEWILYCEDDVTFKNIPNFKICNQILKPETGFISMNAHVHEFPNNETLKYCFNNSSYKNIEDYVLMYKDSKIFQHKWFFNYPSCFIRKEHLKFMLLESSDRYKNSNYSIEEGLSYSWLINFDKLYKNYIILQNLDLKKQDILQQIHDSAILNYWNNDPTTRVEPVNNKASMWF